MATQSGINGIMQMLGFPGTVSGGMDPLPGGGLNGIPSGQSFGSGLRPSFDQFVRQFGLDPMMIDEGTKSQLMQMFLQQQAQRMPGLRGQQNTDVGARGRG